MKHICPVYIPEVLSVEKVALTCLLDTESFYVCALQMNASGDLWCKSSLSSQFKQNKTMYKYYLFIYISYFII